MKNLKKTAFTNPTNLDEAVKVCMKIVYKQAHKWTRNHHQDRDDFIQEGLMGVIEAWNRFDGSEHQKKGYRFTSYAFLWIRAYMKPYAHKSWARMNNTASMDVNEYNVPSYSINEDKIDLDRQIEKMSADDQVIFTKRSEGYTFQEIATEIGAKSLHKVRGRFLEICESIAE